MDGENNHKKKQFQSRYQGKTLTEKGEVSLFFVFCLVGLSSLMLLLSMKLHFELKLLHKRKELFLCTKETKGELSKYMTFMGRTNWGIKNAKRVSVLAFWFPPVAASAKNAKRILKGMQAGMLISYMNSLRRLHHKGCPIDPRMFKTPFILGLDGGYERTTEEAAKLREEKWSYRFVDIPYALEIKVNARRLDRIYPKVAYHSSETGAKLSSLFSSL